MTPTLFQKLLGASFYSLPAGVRVLHGVRGRGLYAGRATIVRGRNPLARLCAAFAGLPPACEDVATTVIFDTDAAGETWRRDFGGHPMHSRLRRRGGQLVERLGPLQFRFDLHVHDDALWWQATGARLFGVLPLPVSWLADVHCREGEQDGRYAFLVEVSMPLVGQLIRYEGWLAPVEPA